FLTPDLKPYWGGTYFPPKAKYNRPGFPEILQQVHDMYSGQTEKTRSHAAKILEKIQSSQQVGLPGNTPGAQLIDEAINIQSEKYDDTQGGFGTGMKFPEPMAYTLLLRHWLRTGSSQSMEMLDKSLTKMASGGMYDQLGGGFHRYSTDREWKVPHFEKMLYDNALMAKLYLDVYQATKQDLYKEIPAGIFSYISREMTSPEGGFYSTQDADSEGKEGTFFLWGLKEVLELLGPKHSKVFAKAFAITSAGDLEGKNVLRINGPVEKIAEEEEVAIFEADHIIKTGKQVLFEAREKREKPGRDEKIITSWNGLM
ncbi:MAG: thioredoxin domain-containing protein, partial [bacterium]|nr:thioredoxin domain-containing protein [bacterium]